MKSKKLILSTVCATLLSMSAQADFLGAEAGIATWSSALSGTIKGSSTGDSNINTENDLGYGSKATNSFFWAYIDHPVPLLPNIKIQQTNFSDNSSKVKNITFDGTTYTGSIKSELTLDQTDIIAYWRILDNWINVDLGINIKTIDGNIKLEATGASATDKSFKATIPMLYVKGKVDLPFTGFSAEADISTISYSGNKFTDFKAGVVYQSSFGLGATLGLRTENLKIDDIDNFNADLTMSGAYLGVFYHF